MPSPPLLLSRALPSMPASKPPARTSLRRHSARKLRQVEALEDPAGLADLLGPRVALRHPLPVWRETARELLAEREAKRASRLGEQVLTPEETAALGVAGSRLLALGEAESPLRRVPDDALDRMRTERDPEALCLRLAEADPQGGWERAPRVALLVGVVLVAVSAEGERRWTIREAENRARVRAARAKGPK